MNFILRLPNNNIKSSRGLGVILCLGVGRTLEIRMEKQFSSSITMKPFVHVSIAKLVGTNIIICRGRVRTSDIPLIHFIK